MNRGTKRMTGIWYKWIKCGLKIVFSIMRQTRLVCVKVILQSQRWGHVTLALHYTTAILSIYDMGFESLLSCKSIYFLQYRGWFWFLLVWFSENIKGYLLCFSLLSVLYIMLQCCMFTLNMAKFSNTEVFVSKFPTFISTSAQADVNSWHFFLWSSAPGTARCSVCWSAALIWLEFTAPLH